MTRPSESLSACEVADVAAIASGTFGRNGVARVVFGRADGKARRDPLAAADGARAAGFDSAGTARMAGRGFGSGTAALAGKNIGSMAGIAAEHSSRILRSTGPRLGPAVRGSP
jgi:hypothetical protein